MGVSRLLRGSASASLLVLLAHLTLHATRVTADTTANTPSQFCAHHARTSPDPQHNGSSLCLCDPGYYHGADFYREGSDVHRFLTSNGSATRLA